MNIHLDQAVLFDNHPDAMWIYDRETLRFLAVNHAAVTRYGYSREEFLAMTIRDIRPAEDVPRLLENVQSVTAGLDQAGVWRHRLKSGQLISVDVTSHALDYQGVQAELVCVRDISSLIAAQEKAQSLSRRLQTTLESMSDAFFLLDRNFHFVFLNAQAERLLQRSKSELLGQYIWQEFPEGVENISRQQYEHALASGETVHFTTYFPPLATWFNVDGYPGEEGLAVYFRDVSEAQEREKQLRLLEAAVNHQNDILLIARTGTGAASPVAEVVYANDAFTRRTGFSREDVVGSEGAMLKGPNTQRAALRRVQEALRTGAPARVDYISYTKGGDEFWVEMDFVPLPDADAPVTYWVILGRDITERKRIESDLHERVKELRCLYQVLSLVSEQSHSLEDIFREIVQIVPAGFSHNDVAVARIRYSGAEFLSEGWREPAVFVEAPITQHGDEKGRIQVGYTEARDTLPGGQGAFLREESDMLKLIALHLGQMLTNRDTADRLARSERLNAIGQLTGGVAHDFNNLLTVILGNGELLSEQLEGSPRLRLLADMTVTAAVRGAELTNRLLAFARRQALEPKNVDINRVVNGMESLLRRTLTEEIDIRIVSGTGLWRAEVDPGQLEVALLNLAINARDAMVKGGRLTMETSNALLDEKYARDYEDVIPGQYVLISVSDTGTGMAPEVMGRAFEPFFTTKDFGKGSGLGLSMVYGFVKQSGGHAKIYSEFGEGTTIKLYLPRADQDQEAMDEQGEPGVITGGKEHILVVEDDALVRNHVTGLLAGLGYRVTSASSGQEALGLLEKGREYDLLFTDVIMPGGMNGRELADSAAVLRPGLRVLFTSGYTENAIVHHGRLDRGVHLLGKPYRRQDLAAKVRLVLDESHS